MKRLQTSRTIPVTISPAINQPIPKIPRKNEKSSSTISGVLVFGLKVGNVN